MITKVIILFLLGTAMASDLFMNKLKTPAYDVVVPSFKSRGCPMAADWAPLICKFMQTNMDLYYKPQLIAPSTYIPQLVVEKCETPELKVDLELPVPVEEKKPVLIPQPPELPPLVISKFPVPVITEELAEKNTEHSDVPEIILGNISEAPQLPALEIPVTPEIIDEPEPYIKESILDIDYNGIDEKPRVIPEPPKLPEFTMPEFPVHVEIPSAPVFPIIDIPEPPMFAEKSAEEPCVTERVATPEIDNHLIKFEPMLIPQPQLPTFVMREPAIPTYLENKPVAYFPMNAHLAPVATLPAAPELPVPVEIPSAPELPPMDFSEPIVVKEQYIEEPSLKEETPEFDVAMYQRVVIPQPPELPAFVMPELPTLSFEQEPTKTYFEPLAHLPAAPELPPVSLPEFPVNVEIPSAPVLPPIDLSLPIWVKEEPIEEPCPKEKTPKSEIDLATYHRFVVPQPPELPMFVMPELPTLSFEQEPTKTYFEPHAPLPAAPELPAASLPEFPVNVEIPSPPLIVEQSLPEIDYSKINSAPISIPAPPELPAFVMPELPVKVELEEFPKISETPELPSAPKWPEFKPDFPAILPTFINKPCESSGKIEVAAMAYPYFERYFNDRIKESHNIMIPSKPINPKFVPSPCVYNLVMHHVLPNIASDHFKSLENKDLPTSFLPCA